MKSFSLIIPIYNEEEILEEQVGRLMEEIERVLPHAEYEIVLVENGSTDNSLKIAQKLASDYGQITLVKLQSPSYGQAFKEGLRYARFDHAFQFDIDFWDVEFIELSLLLLNRYDFVIGSKNLGKSIDKRPIGRKVISKLLEYFLKLYFGVPFSDTHGMKALKRRLVLPYIDEVQSQNHFFDSELLIMCHYLRYSFKELPVSLSEIRSTRFSFLIRLLETLKEFGKLITMKRLLIRYSYL
ncbi:hypothetical protein A2963_02645 [Candidatus Roizmanbacteria bacterium RIFCSPLOWO2_01_FULL_40_13]|nr:MAG: hypothetical protein A2963_02645 [Candidatus Roizmanbacteria bacterium RIFCSPLOWO2_01_FULL_40_13]